jgi:Ni,Fe-hydrogenase maturation factor
MVTELQEKSKEFSVLKIELEDSKRKMHEFSGKLSDAVKEQQDSIIKETEGEIEDRK